MHFRRAEGILGLRKRQARELSYGRAGRKLSDARPIIEGERVTLYVEDQTGSGQAT
jgi:hypothetical protein